MTIVPTRDPLAELSETVYVTTPFPLPEPPPGEVIVIHGSLLTAFQTHPFDVTFTLLLPPAIPKLPVDDEIECAISVLVVL